jgi:hypothetical protein
MWKVFPRLGLLKFTFGLFTILFVSALMLVLSFQFDEPVLSWSRFDVVLKLVTPVTALFLALVFTVGRWGWVALWRMPKVGWMLHEKVCPDLNGEWRGSIQSNYSVDSGGFTEKDVTVNVDADLFSVKVNLTSDDGYQSSTVVQSEIYRDARTDKFYLSYLFEAEVPFPRESDDRHFEGAAKLEVVMSGCETKLRGTYFTNRAWQRGLNTAGTISLKRVG